MQIGIIDYGAGNLGNVRRAVERIGHETAILATPEEIPRKASLLILPGVGAFGPAMESLRMKKWDEAVKKWIGLGKPLLGICLGMQLMAEKSLENGDFSGMGLIEGKVEKLGMIPLPHMGWNTLESCKKQDSFITPFLGRHFYFVHGYGITSSQDGLTITEAGGTSFFSSVRRGPALGLQFHPEKSGENGARLLSKAIEELTT